MTGPNWQNAVERFALRLAAALVTLAGSCSLCFGQIQELQPGLYVINKYPCADFPPIASLAFDGHAFRYKTVKCSLSSNVRPRKYIALCVDGDDTDPQLWEYKTIGPRSFIINGEQFRYCRPLE